MSPSNTRTVQTPNRQKKLIVTGASGFIGAAIVKGALSQGRQVVAAIRKTDTAWRLKELSHPALHIVEGYSLKTQDPVFDILRQGECSALIHAAASNVFKGGQSGQDTHFPDVKALHNLIKLNETLPDPVHIITFGSSMVYGDKTYPHAEDDLVAPHSLYGLSKTICTQLSTFYREIKAQPISELRLFNIYGQGDVAPRLIPACLEAALAGEDLKLTAGSQKRDFVHINDVVRIGLAIIDGDIPANVYNVATQTPTSIADIARYIVKITKSSSQIKLGSLPPRATDYDMLIGDKTRLAKLGHAPRISIEDGLKQLVHISQSSLQV